MSGTDLSEFLNQEVWPYLDAAESGLLDDLNPKTGTNGRYTLDCPECMKPRRAYYLAGGFIKCNRENQCRYSASIYTYLVENAHYSKREAVLACARAVGKELPKGGKTKNSASRVFRAITRQCLANDEAVIEKACQARNMTRDELLSLELGYFPDLQVLYTAFKDAYIPFEEARAAGYIPYPRSDERKNNAWMFPGRLIGYWRQPDGSERFWGRSIDDEARGDKYLFASGLDKSVPYLLSGSLSQLHVAMEGPFDVFAMRSLGINAFGIGGASVLKSQAESVRKRGISRIVHLTDSDLAGISGGVNSVFNGAIHGLDVWVAPLHENMDDPDALRAKGLDHVTISILENAHSPGAFLAHVFNRYRHSPRLQEISLAERIRNEIPKLPEHLQGDYQKASRKFGYATNFSHQELAEELAQ